MSEYFRKKLKSFAKSKSLAVSYSCPVVTNDSPTPPLSDTLHSAKCYVVSLTVGEDVFQGRGPTPFIAMSSAEFEAYKVLCGDKNVMQRIEKTLNECRINVEPDEPCMNVTSNSHSLSQTSGCQLSQPLSQIYEIQAEEDNVEEFQLYSLSDSEEDTPGIEDTPLINEPLDRTSEDNPPRIVNTVFYTVPKTKDELMSVFCNSDTVSSDQYVDDDDRLFSFGKDVKADLLWTAAEKGLCVSFEVNYCYTTNAYFAKAIAGWYIFLN